jgi:hypothetical protein
MHVTLDLHWAPFRPRLHPAPEELIWRHAEWCALRNANVRVFDPPLTLVHLAAHYAQHRFVEPRVLAQFAAAWATWNAEIDPPDLASLAKQCSLQHVLAYAFTAAEAAGVLTVPAPRTESRRAAMIHRRMANQPIRDVASGRDYAGMLTAWSLAPVHRIPAHAATLAFPSIETLAAIKGKPVSKRLYLEYLVRPLRPIVRILTRRNRPTA